MTPKDAEILDNLTTAVLYFDSELILRLINPAGEMLLEHSAQSVTGSAAHLLFPGDTQFIEALNQALITAHPLTEREKRLFLPDNRQINVDCTITPWIFQDHVAGVLLELSHIDRQLSISREKRLLSQQSTARELLRGLAHEIKNPLSGLRGAAQLLERELIAEDLHEYTRIIVSEVDRLRALVDRMLGPKSRPQMTVGNIHEVLERTRQLINVDLPPSILISTDYDPSIPELVFDRDMIFQAFLNIVQNAVNAIEHSGEIWLNTRITRNHTIGNKKHRLVAVIKIIDTGVGIPENLIDRIFYPMVSGRPDGSGLGLAISQSLITQHGGLIECQSCPGQTQFTILLPLGTKHEQK